MLLAWTINMDCEELTTALNLILNEVKDLKRNAGENGALARRVTALEKDMNSVQKFIDTSGGAIAGILAWIRGFLGESQ